LGVIVGDRVSAVRVSAESAQTVDVHVLTLSVSVLQDFCTFTVIVLIADWFLIFAFFSYVFLPARESSPTGY
jgi:hypothetical protein